MTRKTLQFTMAVMGKGYTDFINVVTGQTVIRVLTLPTAAYEETCAMQAEIAELVDEYIFQVAMNGIYGNGLPSRKALSILTIVNAGAGDKIIMFKRERKIMARIRPYPGVSITNTYAFEHDCAIAIETYIKRVQKRRTEMLRRIA